MINNGMVITRTSTTINVIWDIKNATRMIHEMYDEIFLGGRNFKGRTIHEIWWYTNIYGKIEAKNKFSLKEGGGESTMGF